MLCGGLAIGVGNCYNVVIWNTEGAVKMEFERERREIAARVAALREQGVCPVVIGIDGMAAAGKTELAAWLERDLDASVIHMGDFILPPGFRTPVRMNTPGGNVHHERFLQEVVPYLRCGQIFGYRVYDFQAHSYAETRLVQPKEVIIVEGAYAMHPTFGDIYDLRVFCELHPYEQLERINATRGKRADICRSLWVAQERHYHREYAIRDKCHMVISAGTPEYAPPLEIERKYLIRMPDPETLTARADRVLEIEQVYLKSADPDVGARIRKTVENGVTTYRKTEKQTISPVVRIEREYEITLQDWNILLGFADRERATIRKTRYCVPMGTLTAEVDVYAFWKDRALCEVELPDKDTPVTLPDWIEVVREVTYDRNYTNAGIALWIPMEEI